MYLIQDPYTNIKCEQSLRLITRPTTRAKVLWPALKLALSASSALTLHLLRLRLDFGLRHGTAAAPPGADGSSPSRPPPAGVAETSASSSPPTASTGDASGVGSKSSSTRPDDALSPVLGSAPRSAADAPEVAPGADSANFQPQCLVSSSGASGDEDIEDIVTAGTDRTVRQVQESAQSHFLALARLVVDLNRRPPLRTDYELDQRLEVTGSLSDVVDALAPIPRSPAPWEYELTELRADVASLEARLAATDASLRREVDLRLKAERLCNQASHERNAALENLRRLRLDHADAARQLVATNIALEQSSQASAVLEQRCRRLDESLADTHKVIRQDREQFKAGIASYAAQLRQLREYLEQSDRQSSVSGGASSSSAPAMPADFTTFLEESGALQLAIPPPPAASGSSEASVPAPPASLVELPLCRGSGADGAASEASVAPGGVFSSPVVSQPRRDGRPTRAASTTARLRSMAAAENEVAPDALVPGLATPSHTPAATQASVASSASTPDPAESAAVVAAASAAVVTSASARRRVVNTHTARLPDLANPLLEPMFTAPGGQAAWCEILNARISQPIASDRVTECSVAGIQAFADWEDPTHTWQRLRARLPASPCTFGADDFMPNKPISIRASGLAIVVKLCRQFTGRAVGRTEHSDLRSLSGSAPTGSRLLLLNNGSSSFLTGSGWTRPSIWRRRQHGGPTTRLGTCVLTVSGSKSPSGSGSGAPRVPVARSNVRQRSCWSLQCCSTRSRPSLGFGVLRRGLSK
ncbi:unnamed protein product [Phytophthora fragariaefolia]|uniref:Unnamed protein product n=1 Tax=Phytophthora fragariaefolia TaxID=1490495 RepID=A0A9W6TKN1_9STRA|nr:unnamed protein product [Phytophthora fragariaefolia]